MTALVDRVRMKEPVQMESTLLLVHVLLAILTIHVHQVCVITMEPGK